MKVVRCEKAEVCGRKGCWHYTFHQPDGGPCTERSLCLDGEGKVACVPIGRMVICSKADPEKCVGCDHMYAHESKEIVGEHKMCIQQTLCHRTSERMCCVPIPEDES